MSIFKKKQYLCPRCYQKIPFDNVAFVCGNNISGCKNDEKTKYFTVSDKSSNVIKKENGMPISAKCPKCKKVSTLRVCPECKKYLPQNIQNCEVFLISIVGAKGSGKSFFVNVLLHSLQSGLLANTGMSARPYDNDSIKRMKIITEHIREQDRLEATNKATSVNDNDAILFNFQKSNKEFISSFIDTAGENFDDPEVLNSYLPYLSNSNAIIFIVDPTQIETLRKRLTEADIKSASSLDDKDYTHVDPSKNFTNILCETLDAMRHQKKLFTSKNKLKIPVAVAFSKVDILRPLFNNNDITLFKQSPSIVSGKFDNNDRLIVHSEIMSLLESYGEQNFINTLNNNLANYSLFGFSAIGHNNIGLKLNDGVAPHRIADPLLWILHKNGMV